MALSLNHFTIRTTDLNATRHFYADVLGLTVGPRPAFPFPGLWMYRGDHADVANAVVHVIHSDGSDTSGLMGYLGEKRDAFSGTGAVDHIAFFADGLVAMLAQFAKHQVKFDERTVTCRLDDAAAMLRNLGIDDFASVRLECCESTFLVDAH